MGFRFNTSAADLFEAIIPPARVAVPDHHEDVPALNTLGTTAAMGLPSGGLCTLVGAITYVALPGYPATYDGRALLLFPDAAGASDAHNQLLAERYAKEGNYYVVMPQLQGGSKAISASMLAEYEELASLDNAAASGKKTGLRSSIRASAIRTRLANARWKHEQVRSPREAAAHMIALIIELERNGISKVACVGYGSGAELVIPLAVANAVDTWAVVHGRASRKLAARAQAPGIIHCAAHDPFMPVEQREEVRAALKARNDGVDVEMRVYPNTFQGFAVRGKNTDPVTAAARQQAFSSTLEFLAASLKLAYRQHPLVDSRRASMIVAAAKQPEVRIA